VRAVHIVDVGCKVADVHRRYQEIHNSLFGVASFRLLLDVMRGGHQRRYAEHAQTLNDLNEELKALDAQIGAVTLANDARAFERELREVLLAYTQALHLTVAGLEVIFAGLRDDEPCYRDAGKDGRSRFTRDKLHYDHLLLEMERLGARLNRLFST
jgi:hypothetical protein